MKPLRWAEPSSFPSIEEYRLHVVEYYAEVNEDDSYLRPVVEILKNWYASKTDYRSGLIKECERVVSDYFKTVPIAA
jgi:hypothetical protein